MQPLINQIHKLLIRKRKTVSVAESCTGGLTSFLLTKNSGSSGFFHLGIVAYSNRAKINLLKIPRKTILQKGAVSKTVAIALAESIRKLADTDYAIGITGIAGPTGGSRRKPVGTVFIAAADKKKTLCQEYRFCGKRSQIRRKSALESLKLLKDLLLENI